MMPKENTVVSRERLLNEAEALFAQKGYDAVTVREITKAAKCNLAAVNYHFGNKRNLYLEVFRSRWLPRAQRIQNAIRKALAKEDEVSPKTVLKAVTYGFLEGPLTDEERHRHSQLIFRELGRPTEAFELMMEKVMKPVLGEFAVILRGALPEDYSEEDIWLHLLSIFSMMIYFNFAREAVVRITGREYDGEFKARLMKHIVEFCLRAMGLNDQRP